MSSNGTVCRYQVLRTSLGRRMVWIVDTNLSGPVIESCISGVCWRLNRCYPQHRIFHCLSTGRVMEAVHDRGLFAGWVPADEYALEVVS